MIRPLFNLLVLSFVVSLSALHTRHAQQNTTYDA